MLGYHFSGDNILSNGNIILDTLGGSLLSFQENKLPPLNIYFLFNIYL